LIAVFKLYPTIMAVRYSFTDWNGFGRAVPVGLANYRQLFSSPSFRTILENNAKVLVGVPVFAFVPLVVAVVLFGRPLGYRFLKASYFFPAVLSPVVIGALFGLLLTVSGPLDSFVRVFIPSFEVDWLASPRLAMWTVLLVVLWANFGIGVLVYLSALAGIPLDLFDAARVDGASWWSTLRRVIVPSLRGVISFWSVILTISLFTSMFGFIYSLTSGGPGLGSTVLEYDVYVQAFTNGEYGSASAVSVTLLVIIGCLTVLQLRLISGRRAQA